MTAEILVFICWQLIYIKKKKKTLPYVGRSQHMQGLDLPQEAPACSPGTPLGQQEGVGCRGQPELRASGLGSVGTLHGGITVTASVRRCPEWATHSRGDDAGQAVPVARVSMPHGCCKATSLSFFVSHTQSSAAGLPR